jgi:DNA-binding protein HU-beta
MLGSLVAVSHGFAICICVETLVFPPPKIMLDMQALFSYDGPMTNSAFIKKLAAKNRRPQRHYQEAIQEILDELQEQLKEGGKVQFIGFGTFYTRIRKAGTALNFKTKQKMKTAEVRLASFRPGKTLKHAVRKKGLIDSLLPKKRGRKKK